MHTSQNLADMLTKVVTVEKLKTCSTSVGLQGGGSGVESHQISCVLRVGGVQERDRVPLLCQSSVLKWEIVKLWNLIIASTDCHCHTPLLKIREIESRRESTTCICKKNTSRIQVKPKVI